MPLSATTVFTDSASWSDAVLSQPNMAIERVDELTGFANVNPTTINAEFMQGEDLSGDGYWGQVPGAFDDGWVYDKPMYGFAISLNINASDAELLGISNGVAEIYLPSGWVGTPAEFFGFTSDTPFTAVAIAGYGPHEPLPPPDYPPYPASDYTYLLTSQWMAYDPPASVPEGTTAGLYALGLIALLPFAARKLRARRRSG